MIRWMMGVVAVMLPPVCAAVAQTAPAGQAVADAATFGAVATLARADAAAATFRKRRDGKPVGRAIPATPWRSSPA